MYVIQVDAGFLLAGMAQKVNGSPTRERIAVDYDKLVVGLITATDERTHGEYLRTYWYDASVSGLPEGDQQKIAELPGTKVRLGRLVQRGQKGVDSRIIADMMRLAWRDAVDEIFLISGDEDIVEGVEEAQAHGCRVTLIGIQGIDQSSMLIRAADGLFHISDELIKSAVVPVEPTGVRPSTVGEEFARSWALAADPDVVANLLQQQSITIPREIDTQLMEAADVELGGILRGDRITRDQVRAGFWTGLQSRRSS